MTAEIKGIQLYSAATRYTVSSVPESNVHFFRLSVSVERTSHVDGGQWAVRQRGQCLDSDGRWDWEPSPSDREDGWLATHRFDLNTALWLASKAVSEMAGGGVRDD